MPIYLFESAYSRHPSTIPSKWIVQLEGDKQARRHADIVAKGSGDPSGWVSVALLDGSTYTASNRPKA